MKINYLQVIKKDENYPKCVKSSKFRIPAKQWKISVLRTLSEIIHNNIQVKFNRPYFENVNSNFQSAYKKNILIKKLPIFHSELRRFFIIDKIFQKIIHRQKWRCFSGRFLAILGVLRRCKNTNFFANVCGEHVSVK